MKLTTKIEHTFDIDPCAMDDLEFTVDIPKESIKRKIKVTEVKRKNFRKDVSTRLF